MATVPFVQQNIAIGRKLHFSFSISLFRAIASTLYFLCKHFTPLLFVDTFNCEFCFRILALSSRSVRASSSVTSAFMPVYIHILSIDSSIYHVLMTRPDQILGESWGNLGEIL